MEDPRPNTSENVLYPLPELMFLVISAVVSGIDDWKGIEIFGKSKIDWLRKFFDYTQGIPWHGTLGRVFAQLDNEQFEKAFIEWISSISELTVGQVVAIDGKRMRGSYDKDTGKAAIHMVSAFAIDQRLCLGQQATDQKSNEITAIPQLLKLLTLEGCTVTIDAMGCQKKIASAILDKHADYILGVKNNQKGLLEQIKKIFSICEPTSCTSENDLGHGRIERRTCQVIDNLTFLDDYRDWPGIHSLVRIQSYRENKNTGKTENNNRYYISNKTADAKVFNAQIRSHWAIENQLHWVLDVTFREDQSRRRKGYSANNFSIFTKMAMAMIEKCDYKNSRPKKRLKAALDDKFRERVLNI